MTSLAERAAQLSPKSRELLARELVRAGTVFPPGSVVAEPVAVVGIGCRFPGNVTGPQSFWELLVNAEDAITEVPADRWDADAFYDPDPLAAGRMTTKWGGFVSDVAGFDADFFGITPREAMAMDPQQRMLLEVTWEALEHAGIPPDSLEGSRTGVMMGLSSWDYTIVNLERRAEIDAYSSTGNVHSTAVGRISYLLGLHGPAVAVDTACSSSLVAVHLACQSLRLRESDLAVAGGVHLSLSPFTTIALSKLSALSPTGRCKTFDASADGYVRSEGAGVVVLKRLADAVHDGNQVLAVVRGSAVNQDGRSNGLTAPNALAQRAVISDAMRAGDVAAGTVSYVETHGTGTVLGDPIEFEALAATYGSGQGPCALGSVKTNLGHLEAAAGIAGFIKATLAVQRGHVPPNLHFNRWNPAIDASSTRFFVPTEGVPWPPTGFPRRAGVSSFGFGGTNAHVVVEQGPDPLAAARGPEPAVTTLVVSGKTRQRVASWASVLADWMDGAGAGVGLADVAHTLNHHRARHARFATVCARTREHAVAGLRALAAGQSALGVVEPHHGPCSPGVVFVYSGQGSQWAGMGRQLLADEPAFATAVDELEPEFVAQTGFSLKQMLSEGEPLVGIDRIQPVLVAVQLALTALWRSYGVRPDAIIGHSMGEVSAAVVSGALSAADGLRVITTRSRLMARLSGRGAMALLELDPAGTEALISAHPEVTLAVYASPRQSVIAGPPDVVDMLCAEMQQDSRLGRRIDVDVASHHPIVDSVLPQLRRALAGLAPATPTIPVITTTHEHTGGTPVFDADHWAANLRNPVRFSQAIGTAGADHATFIEISPHPLLTHAITDTLADTHHHSIGTLQRDAHDTHTFHTNHNAAHTTHPPQTPHLPEPHPPLPSAPWQHTDHWISTTPRPAAPDCVPRPGTLLGERTTVCSTPPAQLWQARLVPEAKPYPGRHRLHGVEIVPASVLCQTVLIAAAEIGAPAVSDVRFLQPVPMEEPRFVQVVADRDTVTVASSTDASAQWWVRHVTVAVAPAGPDPAPVAQPASKELAPQTFSVSDFLAERGVDEPPFAWSIDSCTTTPDGLVVYVRIADTSTVALLDAALHVAPLAGSGDGLLVPAAADSIRVVGELTDPRAALTIHRVGSGGDATIVDVIASAADGTPCVVIRGLRYIELDGRPADRGHSRADPRRFVHRIVWLPRAIDELGVPPVAASVAVVGPDEDTNARVRELLDEHGHHAGTPTDARYVMYMAGDEPVVGSRSDLDAGVRMCDEVTTLVRQLTDRHDQHPAKLWVLTHGVLEGVGSSALPQSCLWGLAAVIAAEQPQIWGGLVDLPAAVEPEDWLPPLAEQLSTPTKSVLVLRDGEVRAPELVPVDGQPVRPPLRCRPDAAYLITGGLGALGLATAKWLADRDARRLVLAGRTALPPRRQWDDVTDPVTADRIAAIRTLEARGVAVEAVALDVAAPHAVQAMLDRRDGDGAPPIRGVIHGAGVTRNQLLTGLDIAGLREVMSPKVAGAQALDAAFPPESVDFFFLIASAATVFGVPGQGSYAAANAYLDALARARQCRGGHTLSIDWEAWRGLGLGADAPLVVAELERFGSRPVEPDEAFEAWHHVAAYDVAQAVVIPVVNGEHPNDVDERLASEAARDWSQLSAAEVYRELSDGLLAILTRELRIGEDELPVDLPFAELGLNSLMAMSIRREAELLVGVELSAAMLWDHPTVAALAAYLTDKLAQADAMFDAGSVGRSALRIGGAPSRLAPLVAGERPAVVPLSFAQSRLWFLNRFEGGVATYNVPTAFRISGALNAEALDAALDDVIARHESLRTIFSDVDGVPFQKVVPAKAGMWRRGGAAVISLPEQDVAGALVALAGYRFDLSAEIPIRAQIYSVGPEQYVVGIVVHHIAFDGWSMAPMARDVGEAYRARRQGQAPQWAPLPVQYVDYTLWQQDWLGAESDPDSVVAGQLRYWRDELAGLPEVVSLPLDRARPPVPSYRGDAVEVRIDPQLWAGVKALAAAHNATASMVLQAVMAVLLHRVGVGEDIAMGTPIAGRLDKALDDLIGFFVNTWVLRVRVNSAHRFSDVLEWVRQKALNAYSNQDLPFEILVEQLNPVRSAAHHPLFQVSMAFQNNVRPEVALDGLSVEPVAMFTHTAKFDLDFQLAEMLTADAAAPMAAGVVSYATDLFDRATIERFVGWFRRVIEAVVADASVVVGDVSLLDRGERDLVLSGWSGAGVGAPVAVAAQLLASAVAADPDAAAVTDGARVVSYRELDEWSTRLARVLIEAGVGPERAVGVAMDRCVELVVALWAVIKAGGAYVPVDPAHPDERIATVLDVAAAVCVLTCGADTVGGAGARPVLRIDGLDASGRCADPITDADRLAALGVDNTAYVIFTSGSTGAPKGVAISHAGLLGVAGAQREVFGLGANARVLMVAAPTFDASVFECLLAVGSGATLVVAPRDAYAGEALTTLLQCQQVSAAVLTPTVLSSLDRGRLDGLDTLITAGEACPGELAAAWAPGRQMFNAYGPTETTIWATSAPLSAGQPVSIGAPIPGVCALVLDARLNPAPIGVVGELYLGGPALARGYVRRADLTAERFVANPYGGAGARMYRTGDLVRWTHAGTLDYLGRADTQIKLRGQRIELGEIENTLLACPQVTQAAATVHHSETGSHLVAYITLEHTTADHDAEIVEQWQHVYDELYGAEVGESGFGEDFRGWNSSYTDDPIPVEQMEQWRSATVDRIMALRPRRVLEIGVGSGLVLARVAPTCVEYWGTDFSAPTIQTLRATVAAQSWGDRVRLRVQPAAVADGLPEGQFDVVVLNSVIQYFPSAGYLSDVLGMTMRLLAPGGALFIGDVPNHTLQRALQTGVALARGSATDTAEIRQRVHQAMLSEPELLLAPEFFTAWAAEHQSVAGLAIQLKRGAADNELTRYRYDVTIHKIPTPVRSLAGAPIWAWSQCASLGGLNTELSSQRPAAVRVTEIPCAGVITDVGIEQALAAGLPLADVLAHATPDAVTPEQLHCLGETTGYHVAVTWGTQPGTLDAVFITPTDSEHTPSLTDIYLAPTRAHHRGTHANDPQTNTKISAVRQRLSAALPDYMVPTQIMVLDEIPLTSSGKIDGKALPAPLFAATPFRAPASPVEEILADIYARVLGLERVGIDESFFDLGGDSLSAMRVVAAIHTSLDIQLPVRTLFEAPSVSALSQQLRRPASPVEIAPVETLKQGTGVPLFCFHPAGGIAWPYQPLGNYLDCPIIGIQQAHGEEGAPESLRVMATRYADRLQAVHPIGPYNLLGWSLGGVIAHEVAIELCRRECVVRRLILLDAAPWGDINTTREQVSGTVIQGYVLELMLGYLRIDIPEQSEPLTYQRAEELIHRQIPLPIAQLRVFLEFFVQNMKASFWYQLEHVPGVFDGDMVIFRTTQNDYDWDLPRHWRPYLTGDITEHLVDCTHLEMLSPESITMYGKQLKHLLEP